MNTLLRLTAVILCLGGLALGVGILDLVGRLTGPQPREWNQRVTLTEELARAERLNQLRDASYRRAGAKRQAAKEVIAGRLGLAEAIERFRELDRQWPNLHSGVKMPEYLLKSEDEWDGLAVIRQVRHVLADRPDEAAAIAGRLEKELRQMLADRESYHPAAVDPR